MTKIIMETIIVNEVPILNVFQENLYSCSLVFFIHGYGADTPFVFLASQQTRT